MLSRRASWRRLVWGNLIQWPGFFLHYGWMLLTCLSLMVLVVAPSGCAHVVTAAELKEEHPHLTLVEICMRPYGVPDGATVWVTNDVLGDIVADTDPERLREAAASAHYVFQFDPNAPQSGLASMRNPLPGVQCHLPLLSQNQLEELRARRPAHTMHDQVRAWLRRQEAESQVRRNRPFVGISFDDAFGELSPDESLPIDHPSAPEGYTVDGRPGKKPWQYHLGYSAHVVIAKHYEVMHPGRTVYKNHTSIYTIVAKEGGTPELLNWTNAGLRPDIVDMKDTLLFEIKPRGEQHLIDGKAQAEKYIGALNSALPSGIVITPGMGYSGALGVRFAKDVEPWNIQWETTAPGVVQYRLRKLDPKKEDLDVDLVEAYRKAYEEGRWRDLTTLEMETYAELFHHEVEHMMQRRDKSLEFQEIVSVPIEAVGVAAEFVLSAHLWSHISTTPSWLPVLRKLPAIKAAIKIKVQPKVTSAGGAPAVTPNPQPAINSRSLGSDQRPKGPVTPPPRKTNSPSANTAPN